MLATDLYVEGKDDVSREKRRKKERERGGREREEKVRDVKRNEMTKIKIVTALMLNGINFEILKSKF